MDLSDARRSARNTELGRTVNRAGQKILSSPLLSAGLGIAALMGGTAFYMHYRARIAERRHPPAGRFIEIDGVKLHYIERGEGPPVVLLHGNGATAEDFEGSGLIDRLAQRYRVIAFDRPGFGYSDRPRMHRWNPSAQAELLLRALLRLNVYRPVVVAHSWGTLVALALALDYPAQVRGLVLVSGYYFPTPRLDALLLGPPGIPVLGEVLRYTLSAITSRLAGPALVRRMFEPQPVSPRFEASVPMEMMVRPWQLRAAGIEAATMSVAAMRLRRRYRELRLPVVIIAGEEDRAVKPKGQSLRLHRELARSEMRLEPGLGHMLHYMVPEVIVDAVDNIAAAEPAVGRARALHAPAAEAGELARPGLRPQ
jgi:pimeloyl-ACP methyl ester carboxylesterase